jgi:hypothetical protein
MIYYHYYVLYSIHHMHLSHELVYKYGRFF